MKKLLSGILVSLFLSTSANAAELLMPVLQQLSTTLGQYEVQILELASRATALTNEAVAIRASLDGVSASVDGATDAVDDFTSGPNLVRMGTCLGVGLMVGAGTIYVGYRGAKHLFVTHGAPFVRRCVARYRGQAVSDGDATQTATDNATGENAV